MAALSIPAAAGTVHDLLALGALVTRLDPGIIPFAEASEYLLHVSGGEYNVASNLSTCFRLKTAIASAMVDYPIGRKVEMAVQKAGVTPYFQRFKHDGVRGPNIATVWSDRGQGVRAPVVFYNRSNEAAQQLKPGSFDWSDFWLSGQSEGSLVPFRGDFQRPVAHYLRVGYRSDAGRQKSGGRRFLRPELPGETLGGCRGGAGPQRGAGQREGRPNPAQNSWLC